MTADPKHPAITIAGVSGVLPGRDLPGAVLTNERLSTLMIEVGEELARRGVEREVVPSTPEFPAERVGVLERRVLDEDLSVRDLAVLAARRALDESGVDPERVGRVVVSTVTPDRIVPSVATTVADALGLPESLLAFDLGLGCNGFVAALAVGRDALLAGREGDAVLLVGADAMTRVIDASDRTTCPIFGDAGGAMVLVRGGSGSMLPVGSATMGSCGSRIEIRADAGSEPLFRFVSRAGTPGLREERESRQRVLMEGRRVFRDMVRLIPERVRAYLATHDMELDDVDRFVFHQANARIIDAFASALELPGEKVLSNIAHVGNTTSASIPVLFDEARKDGRLQAGEQVLMVGFGTGYSLGMTVMRW